MSLYMWCFHWLIDQYLLIGMRCLKMSLFCLSFQPVKGANSVVWSKVPRYDARSVCHQRWVVDLWNYVPRCDSLYERHPRWFAVYRSAAIILVLFTYSDSISSFPMVVNELKAQIKSVIVSSDLGVLRICLYPVRTTNLYSHLIACSLLCQV